MARHASVKEIGRHIRQERERQGMTGEELGKKIGTDKGTISRIERGEAGLSTDRLQEIATALGVTPAVLLAQEPEPHRARRLRPNHSAA